MGKKILLIIINKKLVATSKWMPEPSNNDSMLVFAMVAENSLINKCSEPIYLMSTSLKFMGPTLQRQNEGKTETQKVLMLFSNPSSEGLFGWQIVSRCTVHMQGGN